MVQKVVATELASNVARNKATPYIIGGVILVSLGLTYFGIVRPILCYFKVIKCPKREKSERKLFELNAFNPQVGNLTNTTITPDTAKALAIQIQKALGYGSLARWVDDDEEAVYGAIQRAGSVNNMSLVSRYYESLFDESLVARLTEKTNPSEREKILVIISKWKK
tara:strand:- start:116 stop:613 length:498 start_codon:yes stop_codon:yes gene_type:complete